jgi:hypothetical protein
MEDLRTRAHLVDYDPSFAGSGAIGTVVTRSELAEAADRNEFPATFILDLERPEADAQATVAVDWDEGTLRQLLSTTDSPEIELWFDEPTLAQAFDDVEGHGIREKAALLAVAAVAAGASATPAFARVAADPQGAGGTGAAVATPAAQVGGPLGAQRALVEDEQIGNVRQVQGVNVSTPSATSTGGSTLSTGEIAAIAGGATVLIAAAGFGATRRRTPPAVPA